MNIDRDQLARMLWAMYAGQTFELRLAALFAQGRLPGNLHLGVGEEATAVGAAAALANGDYIFATHREVAAVIYKGMTLDQLALQAYCREGAPSRGHSDITHIADPDIGVFGASGTIGGSFPLALGTAWASKYKGDGKVTLCGFGDGASNRGTMHEAVNMMALWSLPVVLLCDNNGYSISTPTKAATAGEGIAERARGYGIPSQRVDGNDVIAVYDAVAPAVKRAREGGGPSLIECMTYRFRGHYEGDQMTYRTAEELAEWQAKEPIARFEKRLVSSGWSVQEIAAIRQNVEAEVDRALTAAEASKQPDPADVEEGVWS
jgi:TPP-dependent pyruvate/acetoin dehydrogenase alpha subunit